MPSTRESVHRLLEAGMSRAQVARELGLSKSTVTYHARRLGREIDERCNRRYDWTAVQAFYDLGHSITDCQEHFGLARKSIYDASLRGDFRTRPRREMPIEQLLSGARNRSHITARLIAAGLKSASCETCGLTRWCDAPIVLQLHHVNGVGEDNRLENLQLLCPNCHSQTDNWGGRNSSRLARASRSRGDRDAA